MLVSVRKTNSNDPSNKKSFRTHNSLFRPRPYIVACDSSVDAAAVVVVVVILA